MEIVLKMNGKEIKPIQQKKERRKKIIKDGKPPQEERIIKRRRGRKRPEKIMNPKTGRVVNLTQFLKYSKGEFIWSKENKMLEYNGENINLEFAVYKGNLVQKDTLFYKRLGKDFMLKENKVIVPRENKKTINPISKRQIIIGGYTFNDLLKTGYVYSREDDKIYPPPTKNEKKTFKIKSGIDDRWAPVINYSKNVFNDNGWATLELYIEGELAGVPILASDERKVRDLIYGSSISGWDYEINNYILENGKMPKKVVVKAVKTVYNPAIKYRIGPSLLLKDGQCVENAFRKLMEQGYKTITRHFDEIIWTDYTEGVFEDDFELLSKVMCCKINIYTPIQKEPMIRVGQYNKGRTTTVRLMYNNNHIELYIDPKKKETREFNEEFLNQKYLEDLKAGLVLYSKGKYPEVYYYETFDMKYIKFCDDYSGILEMLENNPKIKDIKRTHVNIDAIKTIPKHGIHFNSPDVISNKYYHYDIKKAYLNYYKMPEYKALPCDLDICINAEKMTRDEMTEIVNKHEGFLLLEMECLWFGSIIERWVSLQYVRHYLKNRENDHFIPKQLLLSSNTVDSLNFGNCDYRVIIGMMTKKTQKWYIPTTDPVYANTLMYDKHVDISEDNMYVCSYKFDRTNTKGYMPHIAGYIQNATECQLEKMYIDNKMTKSEIRRVNVDSIISTRKLKYDKDIFHSDKDICITQYDYEIEYPEVIECMKVGNYYDDILFNKQYVVVKGPPGTGKSYMLRNIYSSMSNSKILVPTHELKREYQDTNVQTIQSFISRVMNMDFAEYMSIDTLLIDEYSMITEEMIQQLKTNLRKGTKIFLFGDMKQLKNNHGQPIDDTTFHHHQLTKNYRQKSPEFQEKINECLLNGEYKFTKKQKISLRYALQNKIMILSSNHEYIDYVNDMAIEKMKLTENVPVRIYKTANGFRASEIDYIINYNEIEQDYMFKSGRTMNREIFHNLGNKFAFAVTYHTIQGKTIYNPDKLCISTRNLFDDSMLYVGVSRVQEESQLYVIEKSK